MSRALGRLVSSIAAAVLNSAPEDSVSEAQLSGLPVIEAPPIHVDSLDDQTALPIARTKADYDAADSDTQNILDFERALGLMARDRGPARAQGDRVPRRLVGLPDPLSGQPPTNSALNFNRPQLIAEPAANLQPRSPIFARDTPSPRVLHYGPESCSISANVPVTAANAQRLAYLRLNVQGDGSLSADGELRGQRRGKTLHDDTLDYETNKRRAKDWIDRSDTWKDGLGEGWKGIKFLGRGGNGIVGQWEWTGDLEDPKDKQGEYAWERWLRHVVVKQSRSNAGAGLKEEADIQRWLTSTASTHIPQIYKGATRSLGSGTRNLRLDSDRREVHRMFCEFVPNGDLDSFVTKIRESCDPRSKTLPWVPEEHVWSMLMCLVKAVMVMERGREVPGPAMSTFDPDTPFVHLDLKPMNIFVGNYDKTEHVATHQLKTGDFGLGARVLPRASQTQDYRRNLDWRHTPGYSLPEQGYRVRAGIRNVKLANGHYKVEDPVSHIADHYRRYGSHSNVHGIGMTMYSVITLSRYYEDHTELYISNLSARLRQGETKGRELERGIYHPKHPRYDSSGQPIMNVSGLYATDVPPKRIMLPYSKSLIAVVLECLLQNPHHRPQVATLYHSVVVGLATCRQALAADLVHFSPPAPSKDIERGSEPLRPKRWTHDPLAITWNPYTGPRMHPKQLPLKFEPLPEVLQRQHRDQLRYVQIVDARLHLDNFTSITNGNNNMTTENIQARAQRYRADIASKRRKISANEWRVVSHDEAPAVEKAAEVDKPKIRIDFTIYVPYGAAAAARVRPTRFRVELDGPMTVLQLRTYLASRPEMPFRLPNIVLSKYESTYQGGRLLDEAWPFKDEDVLAKDCGVPDKIDAVHGLRYAQIEIRQRRRLLIVDGFEADPGSGGYEGASRDSGGSADNW